MCAPILKNEKIPLKILFKKKNRQTKRACLRGGCPEVVCAESVAIIEACLEDENASFPAQSMCRFIDICGIRCPTARGGAERGGAEEREGGAGSRSSYAEPDRLWRLAIGVGAEEGEGGAGGRGADAEADRLWRLAIGVVERLLARHDHSSAGISDVCWRMLTYADVCGRMLTYADVC
jgi:hypothetical protein